jgi:hypothetical protein
MNKTKEFINKAIKIHGDKYDYSKVEYIKCDLKIIIICKIHGEFEQNINKHLNGSRCPKCNKSYKMDKDDFIKKFINKYPNKKYNFNNSNYINSQTKIEVMCENNHNFKMKPNDLLNDHGCKECSLSKRIIEQKKSDEQFIKEAIKIHGEIYDYLKVEYINTDTKIKIICKYHGEFEQTPKHHLRGQGCKICGLQKQIIKQRKTTEQFIKEAILIHENKYDYYNTKYTTNKNNIEVVCKTHGLFETNPKNHLNGHGCKMCANELNKLLKLKSTEKYIKEAQQIHGNKYNYSKVIYKNCDDKICIVCNIHGDFYQTPTTHLNNGGCNKCGIILTTNKNKKTLECFIKESNNIHNFKYDYSKVEYINSNTKVIIKCKEHGEFLQTPITHLYSKCGCPRCSNGKQYSKGQIEWLNFLSSYFNINIQHAENDGEFTIPTTKYKADGYCYKTNTIFEYH